MTATDDVPGHSYPPAKILLDSFTVLTANQFQVPLRRQFRVVRLPDISVSVVRVSLITMGMLRWLIFSFAVHRLVWRWQPALRPSGCYCGASRAFLFHYAAPLVARCISGILRMHGLATQLRELISTVSPSQTHARIYRWCSPAFVRAEQITQVPEDRAKEN